MSVNLYVNYSATRSPPGAEVAGGTFKPGTLMAIPQAEVYMEKPGQPINMISPQNGRQILVKKLTFYVRVYKYA